MVQPLFTKLGVILWKQKSDFICRDSGIIIR